MESNERHTWLQLRAFTYMCTYTGTHARAQTHTHKVNVLRKDHPFQILGLCNFCVSWMQLEDIEFCNKAASNLLLNLIRGSAGHSRGTAPCLVLIRQRAVSVQLTHSTVKAQWRNHPTWCIMAQERCTRKDSAYE